MELWRQLLEADAAGELAHIGSAGRESKTWAELADCARGMAAGLRQRGIGSRARVGCLLTNSLDVCSAVLAVWLSGATVVSLPTPARAQRPRDYERVLAELCEQASCELLLVESRFLDLLDLDPWRGPPPLAVEMLYSEGPSPCDLPNPTDEAFIQFSSGTTGAPRGCVLTARAIDGQLSRLREAVDLRPGRDRGAMWLPLSHDMGIFGGVLLCWSAGVDGLLTTPERFVAAPRTWMADCAEFAATLTVAPSFALDLAVRAAATASPPAKLSLESIIVGGERVLLESLRRFVSTFAPYGLRPDSLRPAYGLAEATLAVTMCPPRREPQAVWVDASRLACGELERVESEKGTSVVSSGRPLQDVQIRTRGPHPLGEIVVSSPSLASAYVGEQGSDQDFRDGWLPTGDVGFIDDGELYVVCRSDELIVAMGRTVDPRHVEAMLGRHRDVHTGNCAIVDVADADSSRVVAYLELANAHPDFAATTAELAQATRRALGIHVSEWIVLRRGSLPKTPSGKIQRYRLRHRAVPSDDVLAHIEA